ncbi:hypothetical protein ACFLUS_00475 [Chloroflexota bacterium]
MSLWPGHYMGKELSEPILTEMPKVKLMTADHQPEPGLTPDIKVETASGNFYPYLIPLGARVTWKIDLGSRLRRVAVVMPGPANSSLRPQKVG